MSTRRIENEPSVAAADGAGEREVLHASERPRAILFGASQLLATHAASALVGILSLPLLARNLGASRYGQFSLFMTLLGVVTYQDFIRPLLIRQFSRTSDEQEHARLSALSTATSMGISLLAAAIGLLLLPVLVAVPFTLAVAAHTLASVDQARLAAAGRAGTAGSIRNLAFAAAVAIVTAGSFLLRDGRAFELGLYAWPFVLSNTAILVAYARLAGGGPCLDLRAPSRDAARAAWREHGRAILALVGFSGATAVVVCADRVILRWFVDSETFGAYAACADLAVKLTVVGTALGSICYPAMARAVNRNRERALRRFVALASIVMSGWFAALTVLVVFHRQVIALVLGPAFAASQAVYAWILVGTFVHMLGFLITPWQRARGDFGTQTRAYWIAAGGMIVVGVGLVPRLGVAGAVACYLTARTAELLILFREVRTIPAELLPRWRIAALCVMIAAVAGAASAVTGGAS